MELFENWPPPGKVKTLSTFAATDKIPAAEEICYDRMESDRLILEENPKILTGRI